MVRPSLQKRVLGLLVLLGLAWYVPEAQAVRPHVIVITIDGFPADYLSNDEVKMPVLRALMAQGSWARRMQTVYPTVTGPSHTVLVTGASAPRHGIRGNAYFNRTEHQKTNTSENVIFKEKNKVGAPTLYEVAQGAGLKTAAIAWPVTRDAQGIDVNLWNVKTTKDRNRFLEQADEEILRFLSEEEFSVEEKVDWTQSLSSDVFKVYEIDRYLSRMAVQVLKKYQPNLLLVHLYALDTIQHRYGRDTKEAYEACVHTDQMLESILNAAKELEDVTIFVLSDHGFQNYDKHVNVNEFLRRENLIEVDRGKIVNRRVHFISHGGGGELYILDGKNRAALAEELAQKLRGVEGIESVITPSDYAEIGLLAPEEDPLAPDLVISAAPNYAFSVRPQVVSVITKASAMRGGTHGYSPLNPAMDALFTAWGEGIVPDQVLENVDIRDVAPTVAACLGLKMPQAEGKALDKIIKK